MGDLSANFDSQEFRCKHCGALRGPDPKLVAVLQSLRNRMMGPLRIVSGYRCTEHNRAVGGSRFSQHIGGRAADVPGGSFSIGQAIAAGAVGIGVRKGAVVHIDVRKGRRPFVFQD